MLCSAILRWASVANRLFNPQISLRKNPAKHFNPLTLFSSGEISLIFFRTSTRIFVVMMFIFCWEIVIDYALLYETYLSHIVLYSTVVWGYTAETHLQQLHTHQNKIPRRTHGAFWYLTNYIIYKELHVNPNRVEIIKHF